MLARRKTTELTVSYPSTLDAKEFEGSIGPVGAAASAATLVFDYSSVTFVPLDVQICALLLYNDLARTGRRVVLRWSNVSNPAFKYAERMGFFRLLDPSVAVLPQRPRRGASLYERHRGGNALLLEMSAIDIAKRATADSTLHKLQTRLANNLGKLEAVRRQGIVSHLWTFSAEIIGNIYEHSETPVPGIVAAQRYDRGELGPRLHLVIADSGLGIPQTIKQGRAELRHKKDSEIILAAFRDGLSRNPREIGRGCGLTRCASIAMRYQANLRVRTGTTWVKLITKSAKTGVTIGYYDDSAARIEGTQVSFDFYVDRLGSVA